MQQNQQPGQQQTAWGANYPQSSYQVPPAQTPPQQLVDAPIGAAQGPSTIPAQPPAAASQPGVGQPLSPQATTPPVQPESPSPGMPVQSPQSSSFGQSTTAGSLAYPGGQYGPSSQSLGQALPQSSPPSPGPVDPRQSPGSMPLPGQEGIQGRSLPGQESMSQPTVPFQGAEFGGGSGPGWSPQSSQTGVPAVDLIDSADSITVHIDLPGFEEDDVKLQASETALHVSASRPESQDEAARPLQRERRGRIERTIPLPAGIDVEGAVAHFEDGVCTVSLPKSEESQQRSIAFQ